MKRFRRRRKQIKHYFIVIVTDFTTHNKRLPLRQSFIRSVLLNYKSAEIGRGDSLTQTPGFLVGQQQIKFIADSF